MRLQNAPGTRYDVAFYAPLVGALVAPGDDLPPGGAETQVYLVARALAARGLRVCAVSYETSRALPRQVEGIDIVARPSPRWRARKGVLGKLDEILTAWRTVARLDANVFVQRGTGIDTGLVGLAVKAKRRRFVYSTASTIDFDYRRVDKRSTAELFNFGVRLADTVVVQTAEQVPLCVEAFGKTPVVVSNIIEPAPQRTAAPEAFLWAGKYASTKQPMAYVELARALPEFPFRLVGVPSEKDSVEIEREVRQAAAGVPNLELCAARPRHELMELVERAVAIVSTSPREGMPNVFLEGWARGVPALALHHDPDGIIGGEQLGGFAHGSPTRLAELAAEMWSSRDRQREVAERCRSYVARSHGADAIAERWMQALGLPRSPHSTTARANLLPGGV
jgi:glycosyltransferase involved in cell wall biosynthesis